MNILKRIFFFFLVNILVLTVVMTVVSFFGLDTQYITPYGLDLVSLGIFSLVWGMVGSLVSLFLSKRMAIWSFRIKLIKTPKNSQENFLFETVRSLAQRANTKMPAVGIYPSPEVNAFATGAGKRSSLIAVSEGLLNEMTHDEIEGVLAHEMAHIVNGDMVTMTLLQGVMNAFVIFFSRIGAFVVERLIARDSESVGGLSYVLLSIVFQILFGVLAGLVVSGFSRHREFRADNGGARLAGKQKMIAALKKLQSLVSKIDTRQSAYATLKISDKPKKFLRFFATHPPLEKRISALQQAMIS